MASLVRITPEKGAYVVKTGSREQCADAMKLARQSDKFVHKSVYVVVDEVGFIATHGVRGELSRGSW